LTIVGVHISRQQGQARSSPKSRHSMRRFACPFCADCVEKHRCWSRRRSL